MCKTALGRKLIEENLVGESQKIWLPLGLLAIAEAFGKVQTKESKC
jgi:hypothetical protein